MKTIKYIVLIIFLISLLTILVTSQIASTTNTISKKSQITPKISLEEKDLCETKFYDELQDTYGNCVYYSNHTSCLNTSGPDTACSLQQSAWNFRCKTGEIIATKNITECTPDNNFLISIDDGNAVLKKQIDFSDWGPCVYNAENNCLIVTCVSNEDGAFKGQFTDCKGGKSCQRFEICDGKTRVFYKNSREDFVESDPTFYLNKLPMNEVAK